MDRERSEALLARYLAACESRDVARIVACFAPRAVVIDPTAPLVRGRLAIGRYFATLYDDLAELRLEASPLYWQAGGVACRWEGRAVRRGGEVVAYEGIDVFELTLEPLIARMRAFWDPKDFL
jgi:ketosteroid isomerase-like protein